MGKGGLHYKDNLLHTHGIYFDKSLNNRINKTSELHLRASEESWCYVPTACLNYLQRRLIITLFNEYFNVVCAVKNTTQS